MTDIPRPKPEPKRGWKKLLFALFVFVLIPASPLRSLLPVDETMMLFVPAMAACALVGWWAGGRMWSALFWIALTVFIARQDVAATREYASLVRGWSLLLAGAFGVAGITRLDRPVFTKSLASVAIALVVGLSMSLLGPTRWSGSVDVVDAEFARRNAEAMEAINKTIELNPTQWQDLSARVPSLADFPNSLAPLLDGTSRVGKLMFPALLALESLAALALAWATYHRLSRTRIGAPLAPLREFRFNDQFVWGLIVGLVVLVLPNLAGLRGFGANLVLFFGALYAMRGLGVLAWFMAPGTFAMGLIALAVLVWVPVVNVIAILGFMTLGVTAVGLGVGDTWADWRSRARSTLS
jgi:hypothetical protein